MSENTAIYWHPRRHTLARREVRYYDDCPWDRDQEGEVYWYDGGITVEGIYYDSLVRWHTYKGNLYYYHELTCV
jgi:hypothetical protein